MTDFGTALRDWRGRRRISQLDLALRAETTQRHISFMERGRSAPGRAMVVRLAESLDLPLRERNALLHTAGYAPVYPQTSLDDLGSLKAVLQRILDGHLPYPAIVITRHGDLVASNSALSILTEGVAPELLVPPVNVLRLALHPKGMALRIGNFPEWSRHVVERLHQEIARNPDDRLRDLLAELRGYVPDSPGAAPLGFAVPLHLGDLRLMTTITTFATAVEVAVSELRLEAFLPADEATASLLG